MATGPTPRASSQSPRASNSAVIVPKVRVSWISSPPTTRRTQAVIDFLWTSRPAQDGWTISMAGIPDREKMDGTIRTGGRDGPRGMEQFALGAPRRGGGDRAGFERVEPDRGRGPDS